MGDGRFAPSLPLFGGLSIWEANPKSSEACEKRGALLHHEIYQHSYMHCWRHKTPVILRATTQWFAAWTSPVRRSKPAESLRATALRGIERPSSFPAWGKARLHGMIATAPTGRCRASGSGACRCRSSCTRDRSAASAHARSARRRSRNAWSRAASRRGRRVDTRELLGADASSYEKVRTRWTSGSIPARRTYTVLRGSHRDETSSRRTSTSKARTSTAAGSIRRCWSRA